MRMARHEARHVFEQTEGATVPLTEDELYGRLFD